MRIVCQPRLQSRLPWYLRPQQLQYLPPAFRQDYGLTRYRASALMTFGFNKREIRQLVGRASPDIGRAA